MNQDQSGTGDFQPSITLAGGGNGMAIAQISNSIADLALARAMVLTNNSPDESKQTIRAIDAVDQHLRNIMDGIAELQIFPTNVPSDQQPALGLLRDALRVLNNQGGGDSPSLEQMMQQFATELMAEKAKPIAG